LKNIIGKLTLENKPKSQPPGAPPANPDNKPPKEFLIFNIRKGENFDGTDLLPKEKEGMISVTCTDKVEGDPRFGP
jgi:hypothetical protein